MVSCCHTMSYCGFLWYCNWCLNKWECSGDRPTCLVRITDCWDLDLAFSSFQVEICEVSVQNRSRIFVSQLQVWCVLRLERQKPVDMPLEAPGCLGVMRELADRMWTCGYMWRSKSKISHSCCFKFWMRLRSFDSYTCRLDNFCMVFLWATVDGQHPAPGDVV